MTVQTMHVLEADHGDVEVKWDQDDADTVAVAKRTFDDLKSKGFMAYRAEEGGARGTQIRRFDPAAERIVMVRPNQGG